MTGLNTQTDLYHAPPNTGKRHLQKPTHSPATAFSLKSLKNQWPPKLSQKSNNNTLTTAFRQHTRSTIPHKPQKTTFYSEWHHCHNRKVILHLYVMCLGLSTAFYMIDHQIILDWWNNWFGPGGNAQKCEVSYRVSSLVKFCPIPSNRCLVFPRVQCCEHFGL